MTDTADTTTGRALPPTGTLWGPRSLCLIVAGLLVTMTLLPNELLRAIRTSGTWLGSLAWLGGVAFVGLGIWLRPVTGWLGKTATRRVGVLVALCAALCVALYFAIALLASSDAYRILVLRSVFLLVAALLPAILYWMFIATRKSSLFYEFLSCINRLGLFQPRRFPPTMPGAEPREESEPERQRRVAGYLQRFEASYGPLPVDTRNRVLHNLDPNVDSDATGEQIRVPLWSLLSSETVVPVLVLTGLVTFLWLPVLLQEFLVSDGGKTLRPEDPLAVGLSPTMAAFLGAYFFSLQNLFWRYMRKDLRPSAYIAATQRIILATVGTWILYSLVAFIGLSNQDAGHDQSLLIVLGFVIGVFPNVLWQYVQAAVKRILPTSSILPSLDSRMPISDLDGLTVWHQARLEEEDIENLPNMATADLVDLMLSTKFPAERLVDWTDQAILYTQLGTEADEAGTQARRAALRRYGIRTATGLTETFRRAAAHNATADLEKILPGGPPSPARALADSLETVPNLKLIRRWRGLPTPGDGVTSSSRRGAGHGAPCVPPADAGVPQRDTPTETLYLN